MTFPGVDELEAAGLLDSPDPEEGGGQKRGARSVAIRRTEGECARPMTAEEPEEDDSAEAVSTTVVPLSSRSVQS